MRREGDPQNRRKTDSRTLVPGLFILALALSLLPLSAGTIRAEQGGALLISGTEVAQGPRAPQPAPARKTPAAAPATLPGRAAKWARPNQI